MRVIAGSARGVPLMSPRGSKMRPTQDRVREALFNILAPRLQDSRFLDLFAGTGANGIEALSRGASEAVFVDDDMDAARLILANLKKTRLEADSLCLRYCLPENLNRISGTFDIIFADPPYRYAAYTQLLETLSGCNLKRDGGIVVIEHTKSAVLPVQAGTLMQSRSTTYGETILSFYS